MTTPTLYYNNALLRSLEGLGDGTVHNRAVSATPDQANKRFTMGAQTRIADLAGVSDDYFNGYTLWFPETKGRYLVTDWEDGAGRATTLETPSLIDTGPCEFRRVLYAPWPLASHPAPRACDGLPSQKLRMVSSSASLTVDVHLPNLIGNGGFEELAVGAFPSSQQGPGVWGGASNNWTVASSSALLGSRMALWTIGASDELFDQQITGVMKAGRRYRLLMKCEAIGGNPGSSGILQVKLSNLADTVQLDADWNGSGVWNVPLTTTGAQWMSSDVVPDITTDQIRLRIRGVKANQGAATGVRVDEVYLWEVVPVSALLAFGHNWDGIGANLYVIGRRCSPSRTGFSSGTGTDDTYLIAAETVNGSSPVQKTWTVADPPTANQAFPIYTIYIPVNASFQYEVGEVLLAQAWPWGKHPERGWETQKRRYRKDRAEALGGARRTALYHEQRRFDARVVSVPVVDEAIWEGTFREYHIKREDPFAVEIPGKFDSQPILMRCDEAKLNHSGVRPDADFEFGEVL